jgi:hypothetical protein
MTITLMMSLIMMYMGVLFSILNTEFHYHYLEIRIWQTTVTCSTSICKTPANKHHQNKKNKKNNLNTSKKKSKRVVIIILIIIIIIITIIITVTSPSSS